MLNPSFGLAYLGIGDLYVTAVTQCSGSTLEREDQAVYWLAIDWYVKAQQAPPSDKSAVNEATMKMNLYRQHFPDAQALFFKGWVVGERYTIDYGCYSWIGETTTVKAL